jgi:hypothetical protein
MATQTVIHREGNRKAGSDTDAAAAPTDPAIDSPLGFTLLHTSTALREGLYPMATWNAKRCIAVSPSLLCLGVSAKR